VAEFEAADKQQEHEVIGFLLAGLRVAVNSDRLLSGRWLSEVLPRIGPDWKAPASGRDAIKRSL
jgi:hypothetical protein